MKLFATGKLFREIGVFLTFLIFFEFFEKLIFLTSLTQNQSILKTSSSAYKLMEWCRNMSWKFELNRFNGFCVIREQTDGRTDRITDLYIYIRLRILNLTFMLIIWSICNNDSKCWNGYIIKKIKESHGRLSKKS